MVERVILEAGDQPSLMIDDLYQTTYGRTELVKNEGIHAAIITRLQVGEEFIGILQYPQQRSAAAIYHS